MHHGYNVTVWCGSGQDVGLVALGGFISGPGFNNRLICLEWQIQSTLQIDNAWLIVPLNKPLFYWSSCSHRTLLRTPATNTHLHRRTHIKNWNLTINIPITCSVYLQLVYIMPTFFSLTWILASLKAVHMQAQNGCSYSTSSTGSMNKTVKITRADGTHLDVHYFIITFNRKINRLIPNHALCPEGKRHVFNTDTHTVNLRE